MTRSEQLINWQQVGEKTVHHLQALLRLDTRNPPGNETLAATYLSEVLTRASIESVIVGPTPQRGTLIARLRGDGSMPPLLLMSHTDVVPVEFEHWTQNPFGGEIVNGFVYGRGALDMKFMTAIELMTMLLLKEHHVPLKRDVILMAEADEEAGGQNGAAWVVAHHPELIQAEYVVNRLKVRTQMLDRGSFVRTLSQKKFGPRFGMISISLPHFTIKRSFQQRRCTTDFHS